MPVRQAAPPDGTVLIADSTSATGWRVGPDLRDTGVWDVTDLLVPPWTRTAYGWGTYLQRVGERVTLDAYLAPGDKSSQTILTVGAGFRPTQKAYGTYVGVGVIAPIMVQIATNGALSSPYIGYPGAPTNGFLHMAWTCREPWPTVLPGTPA